MWEFIKALYNNFKDNNSNLTAIYTDTCRYDDALICRH